VKRKSFYNLSLLLPYVLLLIAGGVTYFADQSSFFSGSSSPNILIGTLIFFTLSGLIWVPLYTWMVIVMLFWGRGKSAKEVRGLYLLSPLILACAMGIPALLVNAPYSGKFLLSGFIRMYNLGFILPALFREVDTEQGLSIGLAWMFMGGLCIVIGYLFVGCALLIERQLSKRNVFLNEG
jgi:hypothetical protein